MQPLVERDYFTDYATAKDPYAFFEAVREQGPVYQPAGRDYLIVTGFQETLEILRNHEDFSAIIGLQGAAMPLPFSPEGSDISAQVEAHRHQFIGGNQVVNLDGLPHTNLRALINTLFVPSRLKASEEFIADFSDTMARQYVAKGEVEMIGTIATPFVTIVVADLLGVPVEDRQFFMDTIASAPPPGSLDGDNELTAEDHPMVVMGSYFAGYIQDRLANPKDDILTELATAIYPDGTKPNFQDIVTLGIFMFGAGQDTSAKLLGNAMKFLVSMPGLQDEMRADPSRLPDFIEEVLRLEGSTKQTARLARKDTRIGDREVKAGTKILLALAAANRDPSRWDDPQELILGRKKIKEHVGFGRGKHVCAGAPLARVEVRIMLEKLLAHTAKIELDRAKHPNGIADLSYEPSFIIRGLQTMHLKLTPAEGFTGVKEQAPAAAAPAPGGLGLSTGKSRLGDLLKNEGAKALIDKHFPGISSDKRIGLAKGMTLRAIQKFAADQFPDEKLDVLDTDLAAL